MNRSPSPRPSPRPANGEQSTEGGARVAAADAGVEVKLMGLWVWAEHELPPNKAMHRSILVVRCGHLSLSSSFEERAGVRSRRYHETRLRSARSSPASRPGMRPWGSRSQCASDLST